MPANSFQCLLVDQHGDSTQIQHTTLPIERLPAGDVTIQVAYSSLNYKDALACQGHRGIVRSLPHVPGIDAAGVVVESQSPLYQTGQQVILTGYDFGQGHWGGWSELVRVPANWVVPLPAGLTLKEAMMLGTAGFTAAQCVYALQRNEVMPDSGEVVVTGATGGVGSLSVQILAKLGYQVVAVTGKPQQHAQLMELGASRVVSRDEIVDASKRPMLSSKWAGGVDTVGGGMLNSLLRSTLYGGCIAACGLVAGTELELTIYPFLLRGVSLCGIASADCPTPRRLEIWQRLAGDWKPQKLADYVTQVQLTGLAEQVERILAGKVAGRVIVAINE